MSDQSPKRKTLLDALKEAESARQQREAEAIRAARIRSTTSTHLAVKPQTGTLSPPAEPPPPEKRQTGTLKPSQSTPTEKRQTNTLSAAKSQTGTYRQVDTRAKTGTLNPARTQAGTRSASSSSARAAGQRARNDPKRATQVMRAATERRGIIAWIDSLDSRERTIVGLCTLLAALLVIGGALLLSGGEPTPAYSPTLQPLPRSNVARVIDYLMQVGLQPRMLHQSPNMKMTLAATQAIQFEIVRGAPGENEETATVILLGYDDVSQIGGDRIFLSHFGDYKDWTKATFANVIVLFAPDSAQSIRSEVSSHLLQLLVAPYRDFLPTATPTPAPTGAPPA